MSTTKSESTNIPTIIAFSSLLFGSLSDRLQARAAPSTVTLFPGEEFVASRGKLSLRLPAALVKTMAESCPARELSHLMELVPRVLCACFHLARQDFLSGELLDGRFYLTRDREGVSNPVRLARVLGMNEHCQTALKNLKRALNVLIATEATWTTTRKGKTRKTVYKGLIRLTGETAFVSTSALEGSTRGGNFQIASIHEDLFALSLPSSDTSRFVPVPDVCLSLDNKTFNATLAILAQLTLRKAGEDELELSEARLIKDAALVETSQASHSRAKDYLKRSLERLVDLGILEARRVVEAGKWIIRRLKVGTLNREETESRNFEQGEGAKVGTLNKPPDKPPKRPPDVVQVFLSFVESFQKLSKNSQKELLEGCLEFLPSGQTPNPTKKGGKEPPEPRFAIQISLL